MVTVYPTASISWTPPERDWNKKLVNVRNEIGLHFFSFSSKLNLSQCPSVGWNTTDLNVKGICNPSLTTIHINVFVYKACPSQICLAVFHWLVNLLFRNKVTHTYRRIHFRFVEAYVCIMFRPMQKMHPPIVRQRSIFESTSWCENDQFHHFKLENRKKTWCKH